VRTHLHNSRKIRETTQQGKGNRGQFGWLASVIKMILRSLHFCRAMLCISAAIAVLRLFVTFVDHVKTNKHISSIFFHHRVASSHTILVFFHTKRGGDIPTGTSSNSTPRRTQVGYRRKPRFWSNSWLSRIAGRANYEMTKTVTDDHAV